MSRRVSQYLAKARLSALRQEARGSLKERISMLTERGEVVPMTSRVSSAAFAIGEPFEGALERFLADRD